MGHKTMAKDIKQAYVIGHNIGYSKSPMIHNYWLKLHGIAGQYQIKDISSAAIKKTIQSFREDENFTGCNVTLPHKQSIMDYLDDIDETALKIGAVNTVYRSGEKLKGTNTDAFGFMENLKHHISKDLLIGIKQKRAHIIGAGGAARAILYALIQEGFQNISLQNRTMDKAEALAIKFAGNTTIIAQNHSVNNIDGDVGLVINTTNLGMTGHPPLVLDLSALNELAIIVDIVYNPLHTDLLKQASLRGNPVVTGIGMLLHQARPAFKLFFGKMPQVDNKLEERILG